MSPIDFGNVGDLSKPATVLVERISDAVGGLARPWQIKRVAAAEAEAMKIAAAADIEVTAMQRRALVRLIQGEGIRQRNIENIVWLAIPDVRPDAKPEDIDADWLAHFFERCRIVSDSQMQSLWARILAGEANAPASFSKRTLDAVGSLEKSEATLFTDLCSFCWSFGDAELVAIVLDYQGQLCADRGITFGSLTHLSSIGLITFDGTSTIAQHRLPKTLVAHYFDKSVELEFPGHDNDNQIDLGHVMLTKTSKQLARIAGGASSDEIFQEVVSFWREANILKGDFSPERL